MEKKLSICIPTFNRDHFLQQLLVFIENELDSFQPINLLLDLLKQV